MRAPRTAGRALAALTSLVIAITGAVALTTAPAQARVTKTDFGFQTHAFGTLVQGDAVGVRSGPTAYSLLGCTRLTGLSSDADIAGADLPGPDSPQVQVGAVASHSSTFRTASGNVGTQSVTRISKITLGQAPTQIVIEGLRTVAKAWADKAGKLHSSSSYSSTDISGNTGTPLDDVLGQAGAGINDLLAQIPAGGQDIPGLGKLEVGGKTAIQGKSFASATATVLRLELTNPANTAITVGRAWARINRGLPAGVFQGGAYGADIPAALGGVLHVGKLGQRPLPCQGTRGKVIENDLGGFDAGGAGQLVLGALSGEAWGEQNQDGSARAWTRGRVASLTLGPLQLTGVVGKAAVRQTSSGKVVPSATYSIGSITANGQTQSLPDPGQDLVVGDGNGHDLLKVRFGVVGKSRRAVHVTAAQITVLDIAGVPAGTVIRLGNAGAAIKRY